MKNKSLIILFVGIMIFISSTCARKNGKQSVNESKITVLSIGDEKILGPHWDSPPRFLVFLPLVELSHLEPIKPALAERWEHSPDCRIWTFYLRRDVRWHDGVTTTAHDIKFSLDLMDKIVQFKQMMGIVSYEVVDDFTFTLTYKKPSMYALDYWSVYVPKHLLEDLDLKEFWKWEFWTQPVGNGPYRYVRHVPQSMIALEANQDYYRGKPKIQKVILKFGGGTPLTELLSGNVDVIQASLSDVPKLRDDPRFRVQYERSWYVGTIFWNHRHSLFSESSIRRALTLAINRRELARLLYYPDDVSLFDGISTIFQYFNDDLPEPMPYEPQRAEQLLEEAGWYDRDGNGVRERGKQEFRFTAIVDKSIGLDLDKAAVFVQDQLKRVGIRMEIQESQGTLNTRFRSGDFEAVFGKFQNSPIAGGGHLSILGENSPMGYENAEMIRLLKLAKNEPELEERKRIYQQIMPLYTADIPMTILFPEVSVLIAHKKIRGLEEYWDPTWFMEYLWIEEE